jgi:hypothetical protein
VAGAGRIGVVIRRVFNLGAGVSLLIFLATVVLWVRSYWGPTYTGYVLHRDGMANGCRLVSNSGGIMIELRRSRASSDKAGFFWDTLRPDQDTPFLAGDDTFNHRHNFLARRIHVAARPQMGFLGYDVVTIVVPDWFVVMMLAAFPAVRLWRCYRKRAREEGYRCSACGYNLTANASGVCPECGTPVLSKRT